MYDNKLRNFEIFVDRNSDVRARTSQVRIDIPREEEEREPRDLERDPSFIPHVRTVYI